MTFIKDTLNKYVGAIFLLTLIAIWEILGQLGKLPRFILPYPSEIITAFFNDYQNIFQASIVTLKEAFLGMLIAIILAFVLAIIMDLFPLVNRSLYPILIVTQTIPTIALAPMLVLWFGYGILPKVILVVLTTLFPMIIGILNGFAHCESDAINLLKIMSATKWQILIHVKLPLALSYFLSGLRISVSYALISAVVAEWLGGFEGLGVYMIRVKKAFSYDKMFAVIILVSLLSLLLMNLVKLLEKKLLKWKNDEVNNA